ncbi:MAG: phosphonate ABC transporter, permease protein PhnE [Alphaproteobacteria bacterium]|nr:phosphonate ABC transporter, permease protein PhnE [Alphaproteobacteria bacterium]
MTDAIRAPLGIPEPVACFEAKRAQFRRERRKQEILFGVFFALAFGASLYVGEVRIDKLVEGLPGLFNYVGETIPVIRPDHIVEDVREWYWGVGKWTMLLFDTIVIAFLGTFFGTVGALIFCFPASRNLMRNTAVYFVTRRLTEIARAVPELVYAMIFVFAFGLGPLPGVLAIAVHTAGALGKLFSEVNENADMRPVEGIRAAGGNWFHTIGLAIVPQVTPNFLSYTLLRFEINVRGAAVIGFVGAGGIGQELLFVIRQFVYTDVSAIVLMIILTVSLIDIGCESVRKRVIGEEVRP